ncbi:MAG TPA: hypothetical protein VGO79_01510, partial [Thermoanaerobaculia bacterium]
MHTDLCSKNETIFTDGVQPSRDHGAGGVGGAVTVGPTASTPSRDHGAGGIGGAVTVGPTRCSV